MKLTLKGASFSTWSQAEKCPARVKYAKIDKLPDPVGPHGERGNIVHAAFERYGRGEAALPNSFLRWRPALDALRARGTTLFSPELEVALSREWKPTTWGRARVRAKIDLAVIEGKEATAVDYKTGRPYDDHKDQLELYATMLFHLHPKVTVVDGQDWYLDQGYPVKHLFHRDDHGHRLALWRERFESLLTRTDWPAKRNPYCKSCPFNVRRGGPCKEGA